MWEHVCRSWETLCGKAADKLLCGCVFVCTYLIGIGIGILREVHGELRDHDPSIVIVGV